MLADEKAKGLACRSVQAQPCCHDRKSAPPLIGELRNFSGYPLYLQMPRNPAMAQNFGFFTANLASSKDGGQ